MTKIAELKKKAPVLDRNQMKNLVGGKWGENGAICASSVSEVMYILQHGNDNQREQAKVIRGMLEDGTLQPDMDC